MKKKLDIFKWVSVIVSLSLIYGFLFISILEKDKDISYIENKILSKFPDINYQSITKGTFMRKFDTYATDQFPYREHFVSLKNKTEFMLGKREFKNIYISNSGRLLEHFSLNQEVLYENIDNINKLADNLEIKTSILLIPTSTEIYKDELPFYGMNDDQTEVFNTIKKIINIEYYSALDILKKNKDKDIYFYTDHHWTQLGAKIVFEDMFNKTVDDTLKLITDDFYGSYFSKVLLRSTKADKIYAYPKFNNYKINIDYQRELNTLYDDSKLNTKNKYQYFLSGDPGRALIEGEGEGNILILKDSFAHNFIPFLAKYYKEIHVVDPRYYNVDVKKYIEHFKITQMLIIHNIKTLNSKLVYK